MSRKLPIAETAVQSIQFAVQNVWASVRLGWLPFLGFAAVLGAGLYLFFTGVPGLYDACVLAIKEMLTTLITVDAGGLAVLHESLADIFETHTGEIDGLRVAAGMLVSFLSGIVFAPMATLLYRVAAGDAVMPGGFFYWRWSGVETRFVITYIAYPFVLALLLSGLVWGISLLMGMIFFSGDVTLGWALYVLPVLAWFVALWIVMRSLMIIPASAIESRFSLLGAIKATGGNVFRLLGSIILTKLLAVVILMGLGLVLFILSLLFGMLGMQFGDASNTASVLNIVTTAIYGGLSLLVVIVLNLMTYGWLGGAWAALRRNDG